MLDAFIIIGCLIFSILITGNYLGDLFAYSDSPASSPRSPGSFTNNIQNNLTSISFTLRSYDATSILRMHNRTSMVSLVGKVNVGDLQRPLFKPFVGLDSGESYLTRDFQGYKAAKNQSEIIKPSTSVFVVKPPFGSGPSNISLHDTQWPGSRSTNANTSTVLTKFDGLAENCCIPPDVQLAAGTKYVVEMVNLDGAIYTKNGTLVKSFGLQFLFNPTVKGLQGLQDALSDPVLLFDSTSGRWFASISDITAHSIRVAVSITDDPTGTWRVYNFPFEPQPNNCSDQPFIGLSDDKFVVTVNDWSNGCNWLSDNQPPEFRGVQFTVADKSNLVSGSQTVRSMQSEPELIYFSLHPVITLSHTTTLLIASAGDFNHTKVQVFHIDGPLNNLHINLVSYFIHSTHVPPDGVQSMAQSLRQITMKVSRISTGDARLVSTVWYQGKLWLAFNDGCFIIGDTKNRSCIRLVLIDTITNSVLQDFDVGARASSLYYPAISIDKSGNLGIVFGYSSYSVYPSILVSKRISNDKLGSIGDPQYLKLGTTNELSNRYGDYFSASFDPSGTSVIWVAGEYYSAATWSTHIGQLYTGKIPIRLR
ncbi:MAG: hypothetical protein M3044_13280 [Thermoproteota archaeon]|nr:hypothetical protein [Thermoproteota archaeon]